MCRLKPNGLLNRFFFLLLDLAQTSEFQTRFSAWIRWAANAIAQPDPELPPPKQFKQKHPVPVLVNYDSDPGPDFWSKFPSCYATSGKSTICPIKLRNLAWALNYQNKDLLEAVCSDLTRGADIGCKGAARRATVSGNADSTREFGEHVTDAVADWLVSGFAAGPFLPAVRPANAKVNGMMCRQKPNGSVRIILNLSAPKGSSVNDGIDSDDFPTTMSSTQKWLAVLDKAGRNCLIVKLDWASAYKHLAVRAEDIPLQYFNWLGMDFVELCLVFGCASSAGLYDRLAKLVLALVLLYCKFPPDMVCQYLDDVCGAAPAGTQDLHRFEAAYRHVADHLGVMLAPTTDPDKAFSPCTHGTVLGVYYDTMSWTWSIPQEKYARLLNQIRHADSAEQLKQHEIWSLVGRILHYAPLVPDGKFFISELIKANSFSKDRNEWVVVTAKLRRQLHFWWCMLKTLNGVSTIP